MDGLTLSCTWKKSKSWTVVTLCPRSENLRLRWRMSFLPSLLTSSSRDLGGGGGGGGKVQNMARVQYRNWVRSVMCWLAIRVPAVG